MTSDGGDVRSMPRMCTSTTLLAPIGPVRVMTTHLEFYSMPQRAAQAQALVELHGDRPQGSTFRLFDRRYGLEPIACDLVFVSEDLAARVTRLEVNTRTRVSDHQPVLIELG